MRAGREQAGYAPDALGTAFALGPPEAPGRRSRPHTPAPLALR